MDSWVGKFSSETKGMRKHESREEIDGYPKGICWFPGGLELSIFVASKSRVQGVTSMDYKLWKRIRVPLLMPRP